MANGRTGPKGGPPFGQSSITDWCGSTAPIGRRVVGRLLCAVSLRHALVLLFLFPGTPASAHDLKAALTSAYETNPQIDAQRARLRATDEGVAQAKSGWRPRIQGQASYGRSHRTVDPASSLNGMSTPLNYGVSLTQPIFDGFQTHAAVRGAEARVRAGQQQLRQAEASVLLAAVTAYMDVVRDRELVSFSERNLQALSQEVRAARARRAVREVTVTDVAQAEARRAEAQARLDQAIANLKASEAEYERVIGAPPNRLKAPPMRMRLLPKSRREAIAIGLRESAAIALAQFQVDAARHDVDRAFGALLPNVRLEAQVDRDHNPGRTTDRDRTASIFGRVTVPLYAGGETRARVRAAKHQRIGRLQDLEFARRTVRSRVISAWSRLKAGEARVRSGRTRVKAAATALSGVRAEQAVGQRTLLDLLNAQQELLDARGALVRARRDTIVAQYALLSEIGSLDAAILRLPSPIYDPRAHAAQARSAWLTTAVEDDGPARPELAKPTASGDLQALRTKSIRSRRKTKRVAKRRVTLRKGHNGSPMHLGLRGTSGAAPRVAPQAKRSVKSAAPSLRRVFPGDRP